MQSSLESFKDASEKLIAVESYLLKGQDQRQRTKYFENVERQDTWPKRSWTIRFFRLVTNYQTNNTLQNPSLDSFPLGRSTE